MAPRALNDERRLEDGRGVGGGKPETAPAWPVRVGVPSSDCASANGLEPKAASETPRLPRPDNLLMPNSSLAQACKSTSVNWNWAFTSASASTRDTANAPL